MGLIEAIVTIVVTVLGAGGIITIYIKHRLDKECEKSSEIRDVQIEIDLAKMVEKQAFVNLMDEVYECLHDKKANGNLDKVYADYHAATVELQKLYKKRELLFRKNDA